MEHEKQIWGAEKKHAELKNNVSPKIGSFKPPSP